MVTKVSMVLLQTVVTAVSVTVSKLVEVTTTIVSTYVIVVVR
jgi:hypothetical protein